MSNPIYPGQDGKPRAFIIDPDRNYREWLISEIYTGTATGGSYVPKVNDGVRDWKRGFFQVMAVDNITGLSTMKEWDPRRTSETGSRENLMVGSGPGYQSESWRINVDSSTYPHKASIDGRLQNYGYSASYMKIFFGNDITERGEVISMLLDSMGSLLSENIPMVVVKAEDPNNLAIKTPVDFWVGKRLVNGDRLTMVVYGDNGNELSEYSLIMRETRMVRRLESGMRYVQGIRIKSPFLSRTDPETLEFPINMNAKSLIIEGIVDYSDGTSSAPIPIGGPGAAPFQLHNFDNFVPTIEGQRVDLVLNYRLAQNEFSYITGLAYNNTLTAPFYASVIPAMNSYSVKLFAFPVWVDSVNGYELDFYLYSLSRDVFYQLRRGVVEVAANSGNFDGLDFNSIQRMVFSVDLSKVNNGYNQYIHVQTVEISLKAPGDENRTNWTIGWKPGATTVYGVGIVAKATYVKQNEYLIDITSGASDLTSWLELLYRGVVPLHNTKTEAIAPNPNFYRIVVDNNKSDYYPVTQWATSIRILQTIRDGSNAYIEWIFRGPSNDLQLAMSALPLHQIN